jgi:hypothetical protein
MKIFDSSPAILLGRPGHGRRVALGAAGGLLLALAGWAFWHQQATFTTQLAQAGQRLAAANGEAAKLRESLNKTQEKLDAATAGANTCSVTLAAESAKIGAFAKQAAACELIRKKRNHRG